MHGGNEKYMPYFGQKPSREKPFGIPHVDETVLRCIFMLEEWGVE
jgi:hypothetical protein